MNSHPNIFPALRYDDAPAAIEWLVEAFGFARKAVVPGSDGSIAHAELHLGPAMICLNSARRIPDNPWSNVTQGIYVRVDDLDAHYAAAVAAGVSIVLPLRDTDYGSREYSARDLDGHLWGFGTYDMDPRPGAPAVFPEIHYKDGAAALEFLRDAFGFRTILQVPGPNGSIQHAEMALGDGIFMFGSGGGNEYIWRDRSHAVNVYIDDPDAHFANARAHGADVINEPRDTPWGSRGYGVRDLEGFIWGFSTYRPRA